MRKSFYFFGSFFLGLSLACGLLQSTLYILVEDQIFALESFSTWFLVSGIIHFVGALFVLKYYHYKKYWFTFSTGIIVSVAAFCQFIVQYIIIVARELQNYYFPVLFLVLVAGIVYAISLIFSEAGKRPWLKAAGIFIFIIGLVSMAVVIWSVLFQNVGIKGVLQKIMQWVSLVNSFAPIFFIVNFLYETRILKAEKVPANLSEFQKAILNLIGLTAVVLALFFGWMVSNESSTNLYWQNRNFENGKELAKQFKARTFMNSKGETMRYQFMQPLDYNPNEKYPLVVCLHHGGAHGTDNISQLSADPAPFLSSNMTRKEYPAFLFVPQCPKGTNWGEIDSLVFETIYALEDEFKIDEKRRYIIGVSGGGYGSWHFISTRPKMFAAAIPICGGGDPKLASGIVSVWAFHGEKDNSVPVRLSREMIEAIKNAGGNPKYTEFPVAGHNIWDQVSATPGLLEWLFAQKRN